MTANTPGNRSAQSDSVNVTRFDHIEAEKSYLVYAAMKRAEVREPALVEVPLWNVLKALSFAMFEQAFEVKQ